MTKKKIELTSATQQLVDKYLELNETADFKELVDEALREYLTRQLGPKQVREALKHTDNDSPKYADQLISKNIADINRY